MDTFCPITLFPSYMNFNVDYFLSKTDRAKALGLGVLIICCMVMFCIVVENNSKGNNQSRF